MIEELLDAIHGGTAPRLVVDLGCATGEFTGLLASQLSGSPVIGYDLAETAIMRARQRFSTVQFRPGSFAEAAADHSGVVDLVSCLEVLYYVPHPQRAMAVDAIRALLRPDGVVLASSMIGGSPYIDGDGLAALFSTGFRIIHSGSLSLWPLTVMEKWRMKLGAPRAARNVSDYVPGGRGFHMLERAEGLLRRLLGRRADSHVFIIARRVEEQV